MQHPGPYTIRHTVSVSLNLSSGISLYGMFCLSHADETEKQRKVAFVPLLGMSSFHLKLVAGPVHL